MESSETTRTGRIVGSVSDEGGVHAPISGAYITVDKRGDSATSKTLKGSHPKDTDVQPKDPPRYTATSGPDGYFTIEHVEPDKYTVWCDCFGLLIHESVDVEPGCSAEVCFKPPLDYQLQSLMAKEDCGPLVECARARVGEEMIIRAPDAQAISKLDWGSKSGTIHAPFDDKSRETLFHPTVPGIARIEARLRGTPSMRAVKGAGGQSGTVSGPEALLSLDLAVSPQPPPRPIGGNVGVTLRRTATHPTLDQALWVAIRNRTRAISFSGSGYKDFIDQILCRGELPINQPVLKRKFDELGTHAYGVGAYDLLKTATEVFLLLECGVAIEDDLLKPEEEAIRLGEPLGDIKMRLQTYLGEGRLPYINRIVQAVFPGNKVGNVHCYGVLTSKVNGPCLLELIWSYWHEEGMLVQTLNAISRRFQNIRGPGDRDPLAHLETDPLRPLNNLLWGYIQDEQNRLSVKRRAYEYDHHYGMTLQGKAVPLLRPADSRSKFLEGFHNLLHLCSIFYKEDNDTTVIADGFPLMNALREVHLLLAQGAHNQFGDLPWTARADMLIQEWLLARPEMREFLQSRPMVPYKEGWMGQVDTMKTLQGWSDVTVTHFRDLGVFGEQILLSIRYGDWIDVTEEDSAKNWARYWRAEIQGYLHAYRAVTGIDLTNPDTVDSTVPAVHLQKRLGLQQGRR
jgi:hypothetical protein